MTATDGKESSGSRQIELTKTEQTLRLLLLDVVEYIRQKQTEAGEPPSDDWTLRFTGGWVRDKLLGVDSQDIDVGISDMTGYKFGVYMQEYLAIPGNTDKYVRFLSEDNPNRRTLGGLHKIVANPNKSKHLETCKTRVFDLEIDLVNLRKETYTDDSRNPQMEFGTAVEDALRRDATVNALFYNLHTSCVEDLTEMGLQDMQDKILRTPMAPYQTFKDDPLRVLRLIRFASRLGYRIHEETEDAMRNEDIKQALKEKITRERIGVEIDKMIRGAERLY
jgi:tRNA nucleotidyltransferase/poly(A) polymerase